MRRRTGGVAIALLLALAAPSLARADVDDLLVDTTSNDVALDACTAAAADCSLPGAFDRAFDVDTGADTDRINFDPEIFDGEETVPGEATISLTTALASNQPLEIGADCALDKPCVAVEGPAAGNAFSVTGGPFSMSGVAVFGAQSQGIFFGASADGLELENNWFGLGFGGTVDGNGVGVNVTGDDAQIGGANLRQNVFVGNGTGVRVFAGGEGVKVKGNSFGVRPNGALAGNTEADIQVQGNGLGDDPSGIVIGAEPDSTAACDAACNVIGAVGGPSSTGIDLVGDSLTTSTASDVQILGNHIGVRVGGDAPIANASNLVDIGTADDVTVAQNRLAGGVEGISTEQGASDALIADNAIGLNLAGDGVITGPTGTAVIARSQAADPVKVEGNLIARSSLGVGIITFESGTKVTGNEIGLPGVAGSGGSDAIRVFGFQTAVKKNTLVEAETGIEVQGVESTVKENDIEDVSEDAIRITGSATQNTLNANLGSGAGGLFVDLEGLDGPGNGAGGPNDEIEAPIVKKAQPEKVKGTAEAGATISLYKTASAEGTSPVDLKKLIAKARYPSTKWEFHLGKKLDKGQVITALQTDEDGNSSELSLGEKVEK